MRFLKQVDYLLLCRLAQNRWHSEPLPRLWNMAHHASHGRNVQLPGCTTCFSALLVARGGFQVPAGILKSAEIVGVLVTLPVRNHSQEKAE